MNNLFFYSLIFVTLHHKQLFYQKIFITNKEESHPKSVVGSDADTFIKIKCIEYPVFPEIFMLEIDHTG